MAKKGLLVNVYRNGGDCSNGGLTSKHNSFILAGDGPFNSDPETPALRLVRRDIGGKEYLHAEPFDRPDNMIGPMAGGTFIYSSDARFPSKYPISVHDRFETQEQYDFNWT